MPEEGPWKTQPDLGGKGVNEICRRDFGVGEWRQQARRSDAGLARWPSNGTDPSSAKWRSHLPEIPPEEYRCQGSQVSDGLARLACSQRPRKPAAAIVRTRARP